MATRQQQKGIQYEDLVPKSEWKDQPEATILTIDLPGFAKEQIKVTYVHTSKMIRVIGERPLADRRWSRFNEVFSVPQNCIVDKIHGSFKNNVLTITMPKETITKVANLPEASKTEAAALEKRLLEESRRKEKEEEEAKEKKKKQLLEEKEEIIRKLQEEAKAKETEMRKLQEEAKAKEEAEARKLQEEVEAEEKLEKKKKKNLVEEVKEKLEKKRLEELKLAKEAKENLEKKKLEGLKRVEDVKERLEKKKLEGLKLVEEAKEKHEKKKKLVEEAKQKKIHETKNVDESGGKEQILKLEERKLPEVVYTKSGSGSSGTQPESSGPKSGSMGIGEVMKKAEEKLGNLVEKEKNMGKGIIEKIRRKETTSEEKKLMINVGVAALVIFALGAYVSYAFCSSSSPPPSSSSTTKPE